MLSPTHLADNLLLLAREQLRLDPHLAERRLDGLGEFRLRRPGKMIQRDGETVRITALASEAVHAQIAIGLMGQGSCLLHYARAAGRQAIE
jgi:hypothetical protein